MSRTVFPADYVARVYAGVLGKMIGVYLGRPFEGWSYEKIMADLGEITYYVHDRLGVPLIVTDDDLSGTFTFVRALPDYGNSLALTPAQIGQTWLNYLIERRTILWWGGMGNSTEHTAYLRLKRGIPAPQSGSIALNGKVVAEQIGAQIFIDGWAMVSPGNPEQAVELARKAASVSHDGEALYGAQVLAAMEAQAFIENDLDALLDVGVSFIPRDSIIYRLIRDIRAWHAAEPDWRKTRERIVAEYGYDRYGGNCHMVPNHALIILALLYGEDNFQRSLMIVNTSGWDTDCNSGNVGCLLGIKNGLRGFEGGPDWRGPVADRLYIPTADSGSAITDAVTQAYRIVNIGRALAGQPPLAPKGGARFHFEAPGSLQGFQLERRAGEARLENVAGQSLDGKCCLALHYDRLAPGKPVCVTTPTFIPPDAITMSGYGLLASPTLYPGQTARASLIADKTNRGSVIGQLVIRYYGDDDRLTAMRGPEVTLVAGQHAALEWRVPDTGGAPIAAIGIEAHAPQEASGSIYLDYLTWDGTPELTLTRPRTGGKMWRRAWVDGLDQFAASAPEPYRLIQNYGRGLLMQGTRDWIDYRVSATITPHLAQAIGIGARVQGMSRYYALLLSSDNRVRLLKALDGEAVLAERDLACCSILETDRREKTILNAVHCTPIGDKYINRNRNGQLISHWELYRPYKLSLQVVGTRLVAWVDEQQVFDVQDSTAALTGGGIALICEEGRAAVDLVQVAPPA